MQFPLIGSCVLFGLYLVVKFIKKEYLDVLISLYFAGLGAFGLYGAAQPPVSEALGGDKLKKFTVNFHWKVWRSTKEEDGKLAQHHAPEECCSPRAKSRTQEWLWPGRRTSHTRGRLRLAPVHFCRPTRVTAELGVPSR
jgi:hypothetical protein